MTSSSTTQPSPPSSSPSFEKTARKDLNEAGLSGSSMDSTQLVIGEGLLSGLREPKVLGGILATVLGVTLAYSGWTSYRANQLNEGSDALFQAQKSLNEVQLKEARIAAGLPAEAAQEKPAASDAADKKTPEEKAAALKAAEQKREQEQLESKKVSEQLQKIQSEKFDIQTRYSSSVEALKKVAEKYSSIRPGYEARLVLAGLYYDHGDLTQALVHYEAAAQNAPSRLDQGLALNLVATVYESQGKMADALKAFEKAVATGEPAAQSEGLLGVARSAQAQGNVDRARSALEQLKKQFVDTPVAVRADSLLQDLPVKPQPESANKTASQETQK